ncbi:MAG: DUF2752 domain-containing protein [Phycisphaerales bacterium]
MAGALLAVMIVGTSLTPAAEGHGTHQQLGLPACAFYVSTGSPCPTCGMTTAFSHVAHREPWRGFVTQPFGALLAIGVAVGFWGALHVAVFGSRLGQQVAKIATTRAMFLVAGVWLASWIFTAVMWRR